MLYAGVMAAQQLTGIHSFVLWILVFSVIVIVYTMVDCSDQQSGIPARHGKCSYRPPDLHEGRRLVAGACRSLAA